MGEGTSLIVHLIKVSQIELMAVMTGAQASNVGHSTQHFLILSSEVSDYLQVLVFSGWNGCLINIVKYRQIFTFIPHLVMCEINDLSLFLCNVSENKVWSTKVFPFLLCYFIHLVLRNQTNGIKSGTNWLILVEKHLIYT